MIDEWIYDVPECELLRWHISQRSAEMEKFKKKKIAWFFNVVILQCPNFNKVYHHDELLASCVSASKFSWPLIQVRWGQHAAIMKKADSVNKTSSDSF